jgi:predicted dehydrogenase
MRFAVIGCGLIGQKRVNAALARGHGLSTAIDTDLTRAEALAKKAGARASADWHDALSDDSDAVIIAVTHDKLAQMALAAVEAGKHVLVEKPAGRTAAEVAPVVAAARKHGRIVKVGYNHRFHPSMQKAREIVDAGGVGPLMYIRGRYGHGGRVGYEKEWRCVPELSGGGEAIDQGSHLIDLSRWFLGDLKLAYGTAPTYFWNIPVDDNCFLALEGPQKQVAWLHATWTEWKNMFSLEICGRDGKLTIDGLGGSYGLEKLTYHRMLPQMGPPETTIWEYPFTDKSWELELEEFIAAIAQKRRAVGDIEDAHAVLTIIDQLYGRGGN